MGSMRESRQASRGRGGRNIRVGREIDSTRGTDCPITSRYSDQRDESTSPRPKPSTKAISYTELENGDEVEEQTKRIGSQSYGCQRYQLSVRGDEMEERDKPSCHRRPSRGWHLRTLPGSGARSNAWAYQR